MSIAEKALEQHLASDDDEDDDSMEGGEPSSSLPSREALREAFDAMKRGDFDGFADSVEALVEIKMATR